jgi:type IV fimbrial biogenesis protein FimT
MNHRGFSLTELIAVLLIVSVAALAAIPGLHWLVVDAHLTSDINALVGSVQLARSESAKRATPVVLCKTADFVVCGDRSVHFDDGWMVLIGEDGRTPPRVSAGEAPLYRYDPDGEFTIRSNRARYTFRPHDRRSTNGTVTFCHESMSRAVIISYTGRPRVSDPAPGSQQLVCAD